MSDDNNRQTRSNTDCRDNDQDDHTRPGIPRPGQQPDQQQLPGAPPQPDPSLRRQAGGQRGWIPPSTGNPDLDPAGQHGIGGGGGPSFGGVGGQQNPLIPQGMIYDPSQLLDHQRRGQRPDCAIPPGARFDPFGPVDPGSVGPGRGPAPSSQFGAPDPDHFQPPGQPQPPPLGSGKSLKMPPRGGPGGGFPPGGGLGGSPFL